MSKISFEEACKVWWITADELRDADSAGLLQELFAGRRAKLAEVGWTPGELQEESRNRLLAEIERRRKEEAKVP